MAKQVVDLSDVPSVAQQQPLMDWLEQFHQDFQNLRVLFAGILSASEVSDPADIADGDMVSNDIACAGAVLGDFVLASFSLDVGDLQLTAAVTANDVVTTTLSNSTGGSVNLAEGTYRVVVIPKASLMAALVEMVTSND